jgi:hypothetical protein
MVSGFIFSGLFNWSKKKLSATTIYLHSIRQKKKTAPTIFLFSLSHFFLFLSSQRHVMSGLIMPCSDMSCLNLTSPSHKTHTHTGMEFNIQHDSTVRLGITFDYHDIGTMEFYKLKQLIRQFNALRPVHRIMLNHKEHQIRPTTLTLTLTLTQH